MISLIVIIFWKSFGIVVSWLLMSCLLIFNLSLVFWMRYLFIIVKSKIVFWKIFLFIFIILF